MSSYFDNDSFNIKRYQGKWHEIAKMKFLWEKDCKGAYANYTWDNKKKVIKVKNTCIMINGGSRSRNGIATTTDNPGQFELSFIPEKVPEGPQNEYGEYEDSFSSDYLVEYTDYDNYAIVGGSDKSYVWVLSRKKKVPLACINLLMEILEIRGYDTSMVEANPSAISG